MKKKYLSFKVKPHYQHIIGNPDSELLDSFWELMENLNHSYEVETEEYIEIIENLLNDLTVNVGDWDVSVDPNDEDTIYMLHKTLDDLFKRLEGELLNNLKHFRELKGLTQEELAKAVGVSRQTISSIESLGSKPNVQLALKIASVLDVDLEDIFYLGS